MNCVDGTFNHVLIKIIRVHWFITEAASFRKEKAFFKFIF